MDAVLPLSLQLHQRRPCSAKRSVIFDEPHGHAGSVDEANAYIVCVYLLDDDSVAARHFVVFRQRSEIHDRLDQIDQVVQQEQERRDGYNHYNSCEISSKSDIQMVFVDNAYSSSFPLDEKKLKIANQGL